MTCLSVSTSSSVSFDEYESNLADDIGLMSDWSEPATALLRLGQLDPLPLVRPYSHGCPDGGVFVFRDL